MKAKILNFRGGRHTQYSNQMVIKLDKVETKESAEKFLGKEVIWKTPTGREIKGKISKVHGNSGRLLVRFEKGMPGQSLNNEVEVN